MVYILIPMFQYSIATQDVQFKGNGHDGRSIGNLIAGFVARRCLILLHAIMFSKVIFMFCYKWTPEIDFHSFQRYVLESTKNGHQQFSGSGDYNSATRGKGARAL